MRAGSVTFAQSAPDSPRAARAAPLRAGGAGRDAAPHVGGEALAEALLALLTNGARDRLPAWSFATAIRAAAACMPGYEWVVLEGRPEFGLRTVG